MGSRIDDLVETAAQLLNAKAAAHVMVADTNRRLEEVRDQLIDAGAEVEDVFDVDGGEIRLEPGRVTARRSVDTRWLDEHFEDLPAEVRELVDVKETATVSIDHRVQASEIARLVELGAEFQKKNKWPKVSDLEERLPPEVAEHAITRQVRDKPVLVFEQRGIAIGQNDRA